MRIAFNGRLLIENKLEGIGYFTWEILKNMVRLYPEHDYLILFDRPPADKFRLPGVEFRVLRPAARHPVLYRIWFDILVPVHVRMWDAEIFVSFDGFTSRNLTIPVVTAIHDLAYLHFPDFMKSTDRRYYQKFQPRFAHRSDMILAASQYTATDITHQFGIDSHKIEVVYNGSRFEHDVPQDDRGFLGKYGLTAGAYFIYTGSLHPRKNIVRLVEAFEQSAAGRSGHVKLVLAGRKAWDSEEIFEAIHSSKVADQIVHTGYIPDGELWNLMRYALCLCYVSLFEGFGVPVLDAFHAGVPVICSQSTSLPEVAGAAALMVEPHDADEICIALDRIWQDESLAKELVRKGHGQKLKFSWAATTQKVFHSLEAVYEGAYIRGRRR